MVLEVVLVVLEVVLQLLLRQLLPLQLLLLQLRVLSKLPSPSGGWGGNLFFRLPQQGSLQGAPSSPYKRVVSWFKDLIKCCFVGSGDLLRWFKVVLVVILG